MLGEESILAGFAAAKIRVAVLLGRLAPEQQEYQQLMEIQGQLDGLEYEAQNQAAQMEGVEEESEMQGDAMAENAGAIKKALAEIMKLLREAEKTEKTEIQMSPQRKRKRLREYALEFLHKRPKPDSDSLSDIPSETLEGSDGCEPGGFGPQNSGPK